MGHRLKRIPKVGASANTDKTNRYIKRIKGGCSGTQISDEPRFLVIGKISGRPWSVIITYRSNKIRIISVRRARKEEVDLYEGE